MLYATVAVLAIILDQIVKYVVESKVALDAIGTDVVRLIPGFIHVTNIHNEGAAFSFLQGARWFFVALCVIFAVVVIYVLVKDIISTPVARWMAVIVLAGGAMFPPSTTEKPRQKTATTKGSASRTKCR